MVAHFNGVAPPKPGPRFEIVRLKANCKIEGYVLSPCLWGFLTHWIRRGKSGFTIECTKQKRACACDDQDDMPTRWKGYIHLYDIVRKRECFVELTPASAEMLNQVFEARESLRGIKVKVKRTAGGDQGRLIVETFPYAGVPDGLPESRDPRPFLEKLWALGEGGGFRGQADDLTE